MTSAVRWNALIRTHHITSRKKISKLRQAASNHDVLALLRSGGSPGIMYVEGSESGVRDWVQDVHVCIECLVCRCMGNILSRRLQAEMLVDRLPSIH